MRHTPFAVLLFCFGSALFGQTATFSDSVCRPTTCVSGASTTITIPGLGSSGLITANGNGFWSTSPSFATPTILPQETRKPRSVSWRTEPGMGFVYLKMYAQKIPTRVLEDMAGLLADMSDAIFLASDFEVIKPDPFMAITTPRLLKENKIYIFAQWNEPSFDDGLQVRDIASR